MSELRRIFLNKREATATETNQMAMAFFNKLQEHLRVYPELNKLIKELQWDQMWKIFEEEAKKSGINLKDLNRIKPETIVGIQKLPSEEHENVNLAGGYVDMLNAILLDYEDVSKVASLKGLDKKMLLAQLIFHEFVHSISAINIDYQNLVNGKYSAHATNTNIGYQVTDNAVGMEEDKQVYKHRNVKFWLVNEAITDGMSYDILKKYAQRTGDFTNKQVQQYSDKMRENGDFYLAAIETMKMMCGVVGKKAGVDAQTVWDGFVRGIFYNGTLEDPIVKSWFANAFSPKFLDELAVVKDPKEFFNLIKKYHI